MKKIIFILSLIICFFVCITSYAGRYKGWKEIEIADLGTIKVPEGWVCHIQNNEIYFTDEGVTEFTEDTVHLAGYIYEKGKSLGVVYKMFDENARHEEYITDEIFSNSTRQGIDYYIMNGKRCEKIYLELEIEKYKKLYMLVLDDNVSYDDVKKMAKSFERNMDEE